VGVSDADDATRILSGMGGEDATRILPTTAQLPAGGAVVGDEDEDQPKKRARSPWTWPLIALIALLVLVLGGTLIAMLNQDDEPKPVASSASTPPKPKPTSPTPVEPEKAMVNVGELALTDRPCEEAKQILIDNKLTGECVPGNTTAPSPDREGWVQSVSEQGNVEEGTMITLTTYKAPVSIPQPESKPTLSGPAVTGETVTLNWTNFECPSGVPALSAYEVKITNAQFEDGSSTFTFTRDRLSAPITITGAPGATVTASYVAYCGNDMPSPRSPQMEEKVQAPLTPSTPPTDDEGSDENPPTQ